jgi:hypothetical protein
MKNKFFFLLVTALSGCILADEKLDRVGNMKLPAGAVLICHENIDGEASGKPVHIDWQAFGLIEKPEKTVEFYLARFHRPPVFDSAAQSYTWTLKSEYGEIHYSVNVPSAAGPWSGCSIKTTKFRSVVFISNATSANGR